MTANTRGEDCLTIQQRVESSEAGRALISAFVLVTLRRPEGEAIGEVPRD